MELTYIYDCRDKEIEKKCQKIFDENNQGYIFNREDIVDHSNLILAVAVDGDEPLGYQLIYFGGDFVELDGAVVDEKDIIYYPDDSVYIWDFCTAKNHENKGVQSFLVKKLIERFSDRDIYTITSLDNERSIRIQETFKFERIKVFDTKCGKCGIFKKSQKN